MFEGLLPSQAVSVLKVGQCCALAYILHCTKFYKRLIDAKRRTYQMNREDYHTLNPNNIKALFGSGYQLCHLPGFWLAHCRILSAPQKLSACLLLQITMTGSKGKSINFYHSQSRANTYTLFQNPIHLSKFYYHLGQLPVVPAGTNPGLMWRVK